MKFSEVIGHSNIKKVLVESIKDNRLSHALMFFSNEGAGNLAMALAFAQYIICTNKQEQDSCGECNACKKVSANIHPDLHYTYPIASSKDVKVSSDVIKQWRELLHHNPYATLNDWFDKQDAENKQPIIAAEDANDLIKKLNYTSYEGGYKIMLIWCPEKMNASSANKLLKILEEPPEMTLFMLVTSQMDQILPTILSRTQMINMGKISDADLTSYLVSHHQLSSSQANNIAYLSQGNYREAQRILNEQDDNVELLSLFQAYMRTCLKFDPFKANQHIEMLAKLGREKQKYFLSYCLILFRESLMVNHTNGNLVMMQGTERDFLTKFAPFVNQRNYIQLVDAYNKSIYYIERNANPKILFMDLMFQTNEYLNLK